MQVCKEKELLRKQLVLLAEQSKTAIDIDLASISDSMNGIYKSLILTRFLTLFLLVSAYFCVCFLIIVKKFFRS